MTFDEKISETVPLSKILDCFIEEREEPDVILSFLEKYKDCTEDILRYSILSERLFSLDFVARCSFTESMRYLSFLKNLDFSHEIELKYLTWQIMQSDISEMTKNLFRPFLTLNSLRLKHPYGSNTVYIKTFDRIFTNSSMGIEDIACLVNRIPDQKFYEIAREIGSSLWRERIYQMDFFNELDPKKQYILVRCFHESGIDSYNSKFIRQVFSSEIDVDVKLEIYRTLNKKGYAYGYFLPNDIRDLLESSVSYEHMMIQLNLYGMDNYAGEILFYFLMTGNVEMLKKFNEYDRDVVKEYFNISDMIDRL